MNNACGNPYEATFRRKAKCNEWRFFQARGVIEGGKLYAIERDVTDQVAKNQLLHDFTKCATHDARSEIGDVLSATSLLRQHLEAGFGVQRRTKQQGGSPLSDESSDPMALAPDFLIASVESAWCAYSSSRPKFTYSAFCSMSTCVVISSLLHPDGIDFAAKAMRSWASRTTWVLSCKAGGWPPRWRRWTCSAPSWPPC